MANFEKFADLSLTGWNSGSGTQTIALGKGAHIGLWGGGPAGEDLTVSSDDSSICVVHEEPRPTGWQNWRHFLLTALRDGETQVTAVLPADSSVWASMTVKVTGHTGVQLVFFPGERLEYSATVGAIYVVGGSGDSMKAAGGPPVGGPDRGGHTIEPTPVGDYVLGPQIHVVAPSWPMSVIPWGVSLRLNAVNEAEYEISRGKWLQATGASGTVTKAQMAFQRRSGLKPVLKYVVQSVRNAFIDPGTGLLWNTTWIKNDFGRWGWNMRRNAHPTAYYVHTTPDDERASAQGKAIFLMNSHGCIHLIPADRDRFIRAGYLKQGVPMQVRPYTEIGPP